MHITVLLSDIIDAIETQSDEASSFLDRETGNVATVSHELLRRAEEYPDDEEPGLPEWQKPEWELSKRVVFTDAYLKLPTKYEVHEWSMMRDFADSTLGEIREDLMHAIHGAGAFRNFNAALRRHRMQSEWFAFRAKALREIAVDWCEEKQIAWRESMVR